MANIFRAVEAFAFANKGGVPHSVSPGDLMSDEDPNYKGREHLFEPVEVATARQAATETASAAPGERRARSTVRQQKPAKPEHDTDKSDTAEEK